jgi:polar amino acid transport system substrate-binding protein
MPFFGSVDSSNEGLMMTITKMILEKAEIPYRFEKMPVTRIFLVLKEPNTNYCLPGAFRNNEREKAYQFSSVSIYQDTSPHYVIRKADKGKYAKVKTIKDLLMTDMKVGLVEKFSYGTWVDENISRYKPKSVIVNIGDDQKNFYKMLAVKRFDYFFSSVEEARFIINSNREYVDTLEIKSIDDAPEGNIRWIIFNKDFPSNLLKRINDSIPLVIKSDEYIELVRKAKN